MHLFSAEMWGFSDMSRIGVWVKLLSFLHGFFGNVRVGIARCVAVTAIAVTTLFSFGTNSANAGAQAYGITFNVTTTASNQYVTMVFNLTGSLMVDSDGICMRNNEDITSTYMNYTVGATSTLRTVKCTFEDSGDHWIRLQSGTITAYPTYTSPNAPSVTYSVFRFSAGQTYIRSIANGSLGEVFYTLGNGATDGKQPRFISTFSGCTNFRLNSTNDGSSDVNLFAGGSSGNHGGASGCSGGGICGPAASWMFANTFYGCTSLNKIPFRKRNANGFTELGFFRDLTITSTSYGVFYQTFRGCTALTNIGSDTVNGTTYNDLSMFSSTTTTTAQKLFQGMFYGCTGLTTVPSGFFSKFSTANANATYLFYNTFNGCSGLTTITGAFTSVNGGTPTQYMFQGTFQNCLGLTSLPNNLFSPFTGTPAAYMFYYTFSGCSGLTSLNANIFSGMGTTPASYMFAYMFQNCSKITTVPAGFFNRFSTANTNATYLFFYTFSGCTKLTTITNAFTYNSVTVNGGRATNYIFSYTFNGCTALTSLPANLFSGFTTVADYMFNYTFNGCTGLTSLGNNIFGTTAISSNMGNGMFRSMFRGCSNITSVVNGLFSRFTGKPGNYMFHGTFYNCSKLVTIGSSSTNHIFTGVGGAVTGSNRVLGEYMFYETFAGCTALAPGAILIFSPFDGWTAATGAFARTFFNAKGSATLNADLFGKIVGNAEVDLFYQTFYNCTGITGSVPKDFFAGLRNASYTNRGAFAQMFYGCTGLGNNGSYFIPPELLYNIDNLQGTDDTTPVGGTGVGQVASMFYNTGLMTTCPTGYSDYTGVPYNTWTESILGGRAVCEPTMPATKFSMTLTTLSAGDGFSFSIYAKGDFYVRWGDGAPVEKISAANLTVKSFSHTYINAASAGTVTVELSSENVTGYDTVASNTALYFLGFGQNNPKLKIQSLSGSLGALFPTVGNGATVGQQPRFYNTFSGATNLQSIPDTLFSGLTGDISTSGEFMFNQMFRGCSALTGTLPEGLFAGLTGTPPQSMFSYMFYDCSNLSGYIPPRLFGNFTRWTPDNNNSQMSRIFDNTGLATSCNSFADAPYQFYTGYESGSTGNTSNSFGGKVSCFNGLTINTNSISSFNFNIYAAGNFYVGWGDGTPVNEYSRASASTTATTPSHTYSSAGEQKIQIGGAATAYYTGNNTTPAIKFMNKTAITGLSGSLGYVFSGSPRFYQTFYGCTGLTSLPATLFNGLTTATTYMFDYTFYNCSGLTSLPANLFGGFTTVAQYMFRYTFQNCTHLTTLNNNIFGTTPITANMPMYLFYSTFYGCSNLTTVMPGLFSRFTGKPGSYMFLRTFQNCTSLADIGSNSNHIFTGVGSAVTGSNRVLGTYMFQETFSGCTALAPGVVTIFSPFNNWTVANGAFQNTFYNCKGTGQLSADLFKNIVGTPAVSAFNKTFYGCTGLYGALPDTFTRMSGSIANSTFYQTFYGCTNLGKNNGTSTHYIPPTFFGGVIPNANATNPTYQMFTGTGLLTECPAPGNQYFTGFEDFVDGSNAPKVSCKRCAYLPGAEGYGNTCYDLCDAYEDNMTRLNVGGKVFNLFAPSEAERFVHHLYLKFGDKKACFVPLDTGWGDSNSGSLNLNTGEDKYHAKSSSSSGAGGGSEKTKK